MEDQEILEDQILVVLEDRVEAAGAPILQHLEELRQAQEQATLEV
jgi:hypothetical protein